MPENRLAREKSPYLLQHRDNPVDWYPWSDEAFQRAAAEDRPIFLSIGYSTCHWCHVMEHESFEDDEVARLMNETFVNIKVDREERPDIDQIYMTVCQIATGHGGWPLTVVLTPDRRPFYVATYIPKRSRAGRPGMLDLVPALHHAWKDRREEVYSSAESLTTALRQSLHVPVSDTLPGEAVLDEAFTALASRFDETYGGFGSPPKFPAPHNLLFLLRYASRHASEDAIEMVRRTLERMRAGGIFDQVGFGFHRYSTDKQWLLPHFEKMLYDQALLLLAYTEAYQVTGDPLLERTAREIVEYVSCDMRDYRGAFYSAEDADSEGEEGRFYVWTFDEIRDELGEEEASFVIERFGVNEEGNFEDEATGRRTGANILHAGSMESWTDEDVRRWKVIRRKLLTRRHDRVRPGLDDKILTDWNGLMIAALAKAGSALDDPEMTNKAGSAAQFILDELVRDGQLLHRYRDGGAGIESNLDDYAFLIWGLIELYEATFEVAWLEQAIRLQFEQIDRFGDRERGGFFFAMEGGEDRLVRQKEFTDGAMPSGNSVSLLNLLRLARMTGDVRLDTEAERLLRQAAFLLDRMPEALTGLLMGLDLWLGPTSEIVLADGEGGDALLDVLRRRYLPRAVLLRKTTHDTEAIARLAPFTTEQTPRNGLAAVYVCRDFTCREPVSDPDALAAVLDDV